MLIKQQSLWWQWNTLKQRKCMKKLPNNFSEKLITVRLSYKWRHSGLQRSLRFSCSVWFAPRYWGTLRLAGSRCSRSQDVRYPVQVYSDECKQSARQTRAFVHKTHESWAQIWHHNTSLTEICRSCVAAEWLCKSPNFMVVQVQMSYSLLAMQACTVVYIGFYLHSLWNNMYRVNTRNGYVKFFKWVSVNGHAAASTV